MSHTPHELAEEFPKHIETIHALKVADPHFADLTDSYHEVNRAIHRAETDVEPTDDLNMAKMRKERLLLKDQIWAALQKASQAASDSTVS